MPKRLFPCHLTPALSIVLHTAPIGRCTNAVKQHFPCHLTRPVDLDPYHANLRTATVIGKCVHYMLEWGIVEERPSPWGSPCTLVAKKNGVPRFCVYYRHTLNGHIVRKSWPFPSLGYCLDAVGGVKFISTGDVLSAFWQLPVAEEHIQRQVLF